MEISLLFGYLAVTFTTFVVNVIPAFAPPTWIVLSLVKVNSPGLDIIALAFFGVFGSVAGRTVMYFYVRVFRRYIPQRNVENLDFLKRIVGENKTRLMLGSFLFSLSPLPSNFLFISSGISALKIIPILIGFALGRFLSYSILIFTSYSLFLGLFGLDNIRIIANLAGVLAAVSIIFIDWKKLAERINRNRWSK